MFGSGPGGVFVSGAEVHMFKLSVDKKRTVVFLLPAAVSCG